MSFKLHNKRIQNLLLSIVFMICSTILSFLLFHFVPGTYANIVLIYIFALILTAKYTDGYWYGIVSSVFYVAFVNYFFTYPYFRLNFMLSGYPLTFLCMLCISITTSTTTSHMKIQANLLAEREEELRNVEKEKLRTTLLRAVSHDIRTPLTSIIGSSGSYLEAQSLTTEEERLLVQGIYDDAQWLLHMVENLLSVTRIQEGSTKVIKSQEVVEEVVGEAISRYKKRQPESNIEVGIPDAYILLPMDPLLIEQVIINLLDNAYVHSESNQPIQVTVLNHDTTVSFHVRDYGIGIAPERLSTIFDGSPNRSTLTTDIHKGMGIGLSICKAIIEAHDGTITAYNKADGAEFVFELPKEDNNHGSVSTLSH